MSTADGTIAGKTKLLDHGADDHRWVLVIMGDGYQAAELGQFAADAQRFANALIATFPFNELETGINIYRVDVTSTDSGARDPAACGDGTVGTGASPRTFFDATFCSNNIRRLLTINNATARSTATAQVGRWNQILVIVNSSQYGGAGGDVAVSSTGFTPAGWDATAIHELGHSAWGLADEYPVLQGCGIDVGRNNYTGAEPGKPNATINTNRATNKWRDLIADGTAMPTTKNPDCSVCVPLAASPAPAHTVGTFDGAHSFHCDVFRPEFDCRMRTLTSPFCQVCARVILKSLAPAVFGGPETFRATWTQGWTTLMPATVAGHPYYLAYKAATGQVSFDRIRPDASGVDTIFSDTWTTGWTSFMPFLLGGEQHYLAYKAAGGQVAIDRIRADLTGVDTLFSDTWTAGWTSFVPFTVGGQQCYLGYKAGTGNVTFDSIRAGGSGVDTIATDTWSTGWTSFMPFTLNGRTHYLAYKLATGQVAIDAIRADGSGVDSLYRDTWSAGWTAFSPFTLAGTPYYLAYKAGTGDMSIDRIRPFGRPGVDTLFTQRWTTGWTTIMPFTLDNRPRYLSYKAASGDVSIDFY